MCDETNINLEDEDFLEELETLIIEKGIGVSEEGSLLK